MCVEIEYDDGSIDQVTNYEVDTETSLSRADKTRTITYKEGNTTLEAEIVQRKKLKKECEIYFKQAN